MRVLLAGFEPFAGLAVNPSAVLVQALANQPPAGIVVLPIVLPVVYATAWPTLHAAIERSAPDLVLATGLAAGRSGIAIERFALNLDDGPAPDNAGERRVDRSIIDGAPLAYEATVPVKAMAAAMLAVGVPAGVSLSAGGFVCNHVFYRLCHHAATAAPALRGGFVHVPWLPEQAELATPPGQPGLSLDAMAHGLRAGIMVACA